MTHRDRASLIRTIRGALEKRAAGLEQQVKRELGELGTETEERPVSGGGDLAGHTVDEETTFALLALEGGELDQIQHAMARIDDGTYGACEACGKTIPVDRLRALPLVTRCVACQRAAEV